MPRHGRELWTVGTLGLALLWSAPAQALDKALAIIKADQTSLTGAGFNVTGAFITIGQLESGVPNYTHTALTGSTPQTGTPPVTTHATNVAGIIKSSDGTKTGIATAAALSSASISHSGAGNRDDQIVDAGDSLGALDIINMSNGVTTGTQNGTKKETLYVDWLANNQNIVFIAAAGNTSGAGTIHSPAEGFNVIAVGATGANDTYNQVAAFSSEGQTNDSRTKPDIVAPGVGISTTTQPVSQFTSGAAGSIDGTSFAAPHVAGVAALVMEYGNGADNHTYDHRTIKAVLLNSASKDGGGKPGEVAMTDKSGNAWMPTTVGLDPLDDQLGAGQVNALAALTQFKSDEALNGLSGVSEITIRPIGWDREIVGGGTEVDYKINGGNAISAGVRLTATLIWDRAVTRNDCTDPCQSYEDTFSATALTDLDLFLVDSQGDAVITTDLQGRASYSISGVDSVEHIYFTIQTADTYELRVKNQGGVQETFSLAVWVPEPGTGLLFATGLAALATRRRIQAGRAPGR